MLDLAETSHAARGRARFAAELADRPGIATRNGVVDFLLGDLEAAADDRVAVTASCAGSRRSCGDNRRNRATTNRNDIRIPRKVGGFSGSRGEIEQGRSDHGVEFAANVAVG